jgi:large subunit ribosomal protein L4e
MKGSLYSLEGKVLKQIELPDIFDEQLRPDLVKRAVLSDESRIRQPKGSYRYAGMETSARYRGRKEDYGTTKNMGIAHKPREVLPEGRYGKVKRVPSAVKGRRAHPPKPEKKIAEEMNKREYEKALRSAIAYTAHRETVCGRMNSKFNGSLPIVLDNSFEKLGKTKDVISVLDALNLAPLLGKAKKRKGAKSALIVVSGGDVLKAAKNIPGVDVVAAGELKVMHLAPGTHPGRITIFTESALGVLGGKR